MRLAIWLIRFKAPCWCDEAIYPPRTEKRLYLQQVRKAGHEESADLAFKGQEILKIRQDSDS